MLTSAVAFREREENGRQRTRYTYTASVVGNQRRIKLAYEEPKIPHTFRKLCNELRSAGLKKFRYQYPEVCKQEPEPRVPRIRHLMAPPPPRLIL